jgi:hypothetical protein
MVVVSFAQAQADETVKANIPFNFYAGNQVMPAGTYSVGVDYANHLVIIRDQSDRHEMFLPGIMSDKGTEKPELVFDRLGDSYFLRDLKAVDAHVSFPIRKAEMRLASGGSLTEAIVALN